MPETFNELSIVGDAITDTDKVVYLLASLPESCNTLVTALGSNPTVPKIEILIERLMHEERKLNDRQVSSESGSVGALAARHKTQSKGPKCNGCLSSDISTRTVLNVHNHQLSPSHLNIRSQLEREFKGTCNSEGSNVQF